MVDAIPYISPPAREIHLGRDWPLVGDELLVSVFIASLTVGLLLGVRISSYYARVRGIDERLFRDQMFWALVFAFLFAHWLELLLYRPELLARQPAQLFAFSRGISSFGGIAGAILGVVWYLRRGGEPLLPYIDGDVFGALTGMCLGRLGCAWVHDHPGRVVESQLPLAVGPWPPEHGIDVWRWDLGLLELLVLAVLAGFVYFVWNWRDAPPGKLTGLVSLGYGAARFGLDFLREVEVGHGVCLVDPRYFGLTPAQFGSLGLIGVGLWLLWPARNWPSSDEGDEMR